MIRVLFFGSLGDQVKRDEILVDPEAARLNTVADLRAHLIDDGLPELADQRILSAANQEICGDDHPLHDGDEIAFFPPVTGG